MKCEQAPETLPCSTRKKLYAERKGTKHAKRRKISGLDAKLTFLPHRFPGLQMLKCLVKVKKSRLVHAMQAQEEGRYSFTHF
jgi:hypothetical protein